MQPGLYAIPETLPGWLFRSAPGRGARALAVRHPPSDPWRVDRHWRRDRRGPGHRARGVVCESGDHDPRLICRLGTRDSGLCIRAPSPETPSKGQNTAPTAPSHKPRVPQAQAVYQPHLIHGAGTDCVSAQVAMPRTSSFFTIVVLGISLAVAACREEGDVKIASLKLL